MHASSSLVSVVLVFTIWALASVNEALAFARVSMISRFPALEVARFAISSSACALVGESCGSSAVQLNWHPEVRAVCQDARKS